MHKIYTYQYSVLQGISPLNLTPFYLAPPPKKNLNLSAPSPPLKILEDLTPPLKCALVQKSKDSFFKETKDFISNNEIRISSREEILKDPWSSSRVYSWSYFIPTKH